MRKILQILIATAGLTAMAATPALAQLSANGAITTDYVWRGVSQSAGNPAVQAGLDYDFGNGFAVGTWASSIDFGDDSPIELDIYGGFSGQFTNSALGWDVGTIGYLYPNQASKAPDYNFFELYGGLNYSLDVASISGYAYYSPDNLGTSTWYYTGGVEVPLGEMAALSANVGRYDYATGTDYTDWNIGLGISFDLYTVSATYIDNDLPGDNTKIVFAISFVTS
ncbi:MAG: hypothetical protein IID54_06415 [Proteobacteria bacterium]|nr:hypothetical protein [Pseudomonadota bacterium]